MVASQVCSASSRSPFNSARNVMWFDTSRPASLRACCTARCRSLASPSSTKSRVRVVLNATRKPSCSTAAYPSGDTASTSTSAASSVNAPSLVSSVKLAPSCTCLAIVAASPVCSAVRIAGMFLPYFLPSVGRFGFKLYDTRLVPASSSLTALTFSSSLMVVLNFSSASASAAPRARTITSLSGWRNLTLACPRAARPKSTTRSTASISATSFASDSSASNSG